MTAEELQFFDACPEALPIYTLLAERVLAALPDTKITVHKTQIAFRNRYAFAFASLPRRRVRDLPEHFLIVSFGLPARLDSPRILYAVEPYPGRWTHHAAVSDSSELDGDLLGWICQAAAFARVK